MIIESSQYNHCVLCCTVLMIGRCWQCQQYAWCGWCSSGKGKCHDATPKGLSVGYCLPENWNYGGSC